VVVITDHKEFDYPMIVQTADLIVDARNATRGLSAPDSRLIRL
jgi:UDP-N-acetyl-D-mannosaminuronate dehydrogenase